MIAKRIKCTPQMRREITEAIGCCPSIITQSLNYRKATSLSNAIRNEAMRLGAKEIITADADKVLLIEDNSLVWQYGNRQATIDLDRKTIIIKDGEEQEKKIVLTITNLIALIKEVKK